MSCDSPVSVRTSRRRFVLRLGGIAIGVAFGDLILPPEAVARGHKMPNYEPNPWIQIDTNGIISIVSPAAEMGQGSMTALPACVAEDLDANWEDVRIRPAPFNPDLYGNMLLRNSLLTGGSRTVRGYYQALRLAGAQARLVLVSAAARKWRISVSELVTNDSVILHMASGRTMRYAAAAAIAEVPNPLPQMTASMLKPISKCRFIGRTLPRADIAPKIAGAPVYSIDTRLKDMVYGSVVRPPVLKSRPLSVDDKHSKTVPGYIKTVMLPYGVGVIGSTTWSARRAADSLIIEWSSDSLAGTYSSTQVMDEYLIAANDLSPSQKGVTVSKRGVGAARLASAAHVLKGDFRSEHVTHMTMEPMNSTARWTGAALEIWTPTQTMSNTVSDLVKYFGIPKESIRISVPMLGGGFGRRMETDFTLDAVLLAKEADGRAVKVTWTREQDVHGSKFRPMAAQHIEVGLDPQGKIIAWHHRLVGESVFGRLNPAVLRATGGKDAPFHDGADVPYEFPDYTVEFLRQERHVDVGFYRAIGGGYTKFAMECMIDEIAHFNRCDPIDFRLELLSKNLRAQAVLREVRDMSDWNRQRPTGYGVGVAYSDMFETHTAQVIEISVNHESGAIHIHNVWVAVDTGIALMPQNIARQVEGGIIWGLSGALMERLSIKDGTPEQSNFNDYPVPRMTEIPNVCVKILQTDNPPGGIGEAGAPPVAPAISNAFRTITGRRLYNLPMSADRVKSVLEDADDTGTARWKDPMSWL
ncbi:isoquinoline 1-oxidoreductase, beta subunit [Burkholderia sp. D7]|nr:isoquinoline 1-oxidoreductase, beta subunit [Burkholderia sp. D7]